MEKQIILSGIQPTGNLTLGNYLGALNNWVKMQEQYECFYMLADLHTLTVRNNPETLRQNTLNLIALYIAAGLDPAKNTLFIQSHVDAHAKLGWILNCYTYMGELARMTQFKDKSEKHADNINAGLFTYPVLMAADILLYKSNLVPVGEDQRQHLEIARDIAQRFNNIYGETFVVPEPYIKTTGARIMGLQNPENKMSKSSTNQNDVIFITDSPDEIMKKVKKSVTDSENIVRYDIENKPGISNLITIYEAITGNKKEEIEKEFEGIGYGKFKEAVGQVIIDKVEPVQKRYNELLNDKTYLRRIFEDGDKKAEIVANKTVTEVSEKIGLVI